MNPTTQDPTAQLIAAVNALGRKLDSLWTLLFVGLILPLWLGLAVLLFSAVASS